MSTMKGAFQKSYDMCSIPLEKLDGKTVLVTGATGLIGRMLVKGLEFLNETKGMSVRILALARNREKAEQILLDDGVTGNICVVKGDVTSEICIEEPVDYIIHTASITASRSFIEYPVEVAVTSIYGTKNILELAREKNAASMVYLSSMEVYGFTEEEDLLTEQTMKYLDPLAVRSCYPGSKRMCETFCAAYASEYQVPVKIIRLAQTFGYGVGRDETRVFAEFARCAVNRQNIVLQTTGESKRMYLDTADAVTAVLTVLLKGENGRAYNAADKDTYCSVREMAQMAAEEIAEGEISVICMADRNAAEKFPPSHKLLLDTTEIERLGWKPTAGLKEMFKRLLESEGSGKR